MKVYVVTSGSYSAYMIEKIFLDKDKAEEFANWCPYSNEIEEYDTADEDVYTPMYMIKASIGLISDEVNVVFYNDISNNEYKRKYINIYKIFNNYMRPEEDAVIELSEHINADHDKEYFKDKFKKVMYDLKAEVLSLFNEGMKFHEIAYNINEKFDRGDIN